jgi:arylsulfatase A-like enzyme
VIGRTSPESTEQITRDPRPHPDAPNVVIIVLDDVGYAHPGCFGSDIETPNMDRLAAEGLRYVQFQATPMCAPTRACLMTGRNAHAVGVGIVQEMAAGYPGYSGRLSKRATTLAEALGPAGYSCFAVGKWHLAPIEHWSPAGPFDYWPLQRGFSRHYGFIDAATDQWHPELIEGNAYIRRPARPDYHLTEDLIDKAIGYVRDQTAADSARPFFLYVALAACHSPLQAPRSFIEKYRGRYDKGWDRAREEWFAKQKGHGILPEGTRLAPRNPGVEAWTDLSADQRRLYARYQEVFSGFLDHTDREIGRLLRFLDEIDRSENTIVMLLSDNGASDSGGLHGWPHPFGQPEPDESLREGLAAIDRLGDDSTSPMYPLGWAQAGNTPFRHYKIDTYAGGTAVPLIVRWPRRIRDGGAIRRQYHHVVDLYPTILEAAGVAAPESYAGLDQLPVHGISMSYSFDDPKVPTRRRVQYFENFGHRAIWHDNWKAVTKHHAGDDYATEPWALYDLANDFSEYQNVADRHPERLRHLIELWWAEAGRYDVLPLNDRPEGTQGRNFGTPKPRYVYYPDMAPVSRKRGPVVADRSHTITADIEIPADGAEGVILSAGGKIGGYVLYVIDGYVVYEYNLLGQRTVLRSQEKAPVGHMKLGFTFQRTGPLRGIGTLSFGGEPVGRAEFRETFPDLFSPGQVNCGCDDETPVSNAYEPPFRFTGRIRSVVVEPEIS